MTLLCMSMQCTYNILTVCISSYMLAKEFTYVGVLERFGITFNNSWVPCISGALSGDLGGQWVCQGTCPGRRASYNCFRSYTSLVLAAMNSDRSSMHPRTSMASLLS
jgi:hypothetical protein